MLALRRLCWHGYKRKGKSFVNIFAMSSLGNLKFDNKVLDTLPLDAKKNNQSRTVPGACFSLVDPTPVENPELVAHSKAALELLGINDGDVENEHFAEYFSGNKLFSGSKTAAHCYCGHQFGYFSGQLGDGAAMYLGEVINGKGERWELQLKGAGKTPYSRNSDGRKVLRSSIREFLCSEAMHHLGVPTTRAGTCVTSDSRVVRDIFYDGHPIMERCTIVSRIAPTFLRFGSFEIFKGEDPQTGRSGPSTARKDILEKMLDYAVNTFFPEISAQHSGKEAYMEFYKEVVRRTARLAALWQCVGFCHGVLNTDNMSIMGITIDYGPFGFMDYFDKDYICNASDNNGRYTYQKQPEICKWNLLKFAEALQMLVPLDETKKVLNEIYDSEFASHYYGMMRKKIGITLMENVDDEELIQKLLLTMQQTACDFTNTFQILTSMPDDDSIAVENLVSHCQDFESFKKRMSKNVNPQLRTLLKLAETHPQLISHYGLDIEELRAMVKKEDDMKEMASTPEEKKSNDKKLWSDWIALYRERIKLEMKSIADPSEIEKFKDERKKSMAMINPKIVLRNHLAQEAIQAAEEGDFTKVRELLHHLETPYTSVAPETLGEKESICSPPPWASDIRVT